MEWLQTRPIFIDYYGIPAEMLKKFPNIAKHKYDFIRKKDCEGNCVIWAGQILDLSRRTPEEYVETSNNLYQLEMLDSKTLFKIHGLDTPFKNVTKLYEILNQELKNSKKSKQKTTSDSFNYISGANFILNDKAIVTYSSKMKSGPMEYTKNNILKETAIKRIQILNKLEKTLSN